MKLTERENNLLEALLGTTKSAVSMLPVLSQIIAGYDSYKRSSFDRNVRNLIENLSQKVDNIGEFFQNNFFKTEEGEKFARKVFRHPVRRQARAFYKCFSKCTEFPINF